MARGENQRARGEPRWWLTAALVLAAFAPAGGRADERTFDALAGDAVAGDLGVVLDDLAVTCDGETDARERRMCETMRQDRRERALDRPLLITLDPPRVTRGTGGTRVITISGCLLCERPLVVGGTAVLVTASAPPPDPAAAPLPPPPAPPRKRGRAAAPAPPPPPPPAPASAPASAPTIASLRLRELGRIVVEDPGAAERAALATSLRRVRVQAIVRLARLTPWTRGGLAGVAVEVVAWRAVDACAGRVFESHPASSVLLPQTDHPTCRIAVPPPTQPASAPTPLPERLTADELERAFEPVKRAARACFRRLRIRGRVDLALDVRPDGRVKLVQSSGPLTDTPSSECVRAAAIRLIFPPFQSHTSLHVTYAVLLR